MMLQYKEIDYQVDDQIFTGYLAQKVINDAGQSPSQKPAVLVVPEWWGRNDYAKARAEKLAEDGFVAMAIDLYGNGRVANSPEEAGELMAEARDTESAIEKRFDAAYKAVSNLESVDSNEISALGYCFGGAVVLAMARAPKKLKVAASFHGLLETDTPMTAKSFNGKVMVFNGADDPMVTAESVSNFEAEMSNAQANYLLKNYPGVLHGFTNPAATAKGKATGMPLAYDKFADTDSYKTTLEALRD